MLRVTLVIVKDFFKVAVDAFILSKGKNIFEIFIV